MIRMNQKDLEEALENGTFKWKSTDNSISEREMYNYISNEVKLNGCWQLIEDSIFRKIRSGLQEARTLPDSTSSITKEVEN